MVEIKFYRDDTYVYVNNPTYPTVKMTIAKFNEILAGLPAIGEGDDDKVLTVVEGAPAWADIPGDLE